MAEPLLEIDGLTAGYGDIQVLWGIDLAVEAGSITCIVGSNGAGKTTLLGTVSGLVPATGGRIRFAGQDITRAGPEAVLKAGIAQVPEGRRLFRGLTVHDNLLLGAYLRDDKRGIQEDLDYVFSVFPILEERARQEADTLSGGEQQMCAIGRGIMSRPRLLMIDELSLGLAPRMVDRLGEALLEINRKGITVLLVEQDVITALELSSRAFVIETGRVVTTGDSRALADDPAIRKAYIGI
jgi:branched-chain amino acid transport system ATP-binding protein